jgi:hypothetical protein
LLIGWANNSQKGIDVREMIMDCFQSIGLVIEFGESMSGAMNYAEDLGDRQDEVEDLRQEKEEHGLGEVT